MKTLENVKVGDKIWTIQDGWTVKYFNNWEGSGFDSIHVLNNKNKNSVDNVWAESIDGWIYTDSIGAWKQKGTPSLIKK